MRDVTINEIADEVYDQLKDTGVDIPVTSVRRLVRWLFLEIEKCVDGNDIRFAMQKRDILYFSPMVDVVKLCNELAMGESHLSYDYLLRKGKLSKEAAHRLKKLPMIVNKVYD